MKIKCKKEVAKLKRTEENVCGNGRRVKFEEAFPIEERHRGDLEGRVSHECFSWLGRRGVVLEQSLQLCWLMLERRGTKQKMIEWWRPWKRGTSSVLLRTTDHFFRQFEFQVLGALGVRDVHHVLSISDGSASRMAGNHHLLPWRSSIRLCLGTAIGRSLREDHGQVNGDDVNTCVGEHGWLMMAMISISKERW